MHWMSVKLPDNFQMREHSWPCRAGFILMKQSQSQVIKPPFIFSVVF